jgi:hypothetical protein
MKTKILLIGLIIFLVNVISVNAKETIKVCSPDDFWRGVNYFIFPRDGGKPYGSHVGTLLSLTNSLNIEIEFVQVKHGEEEGFLKNCFDKMRSGEIDLMTYTFYQNNFSKTLPPFHLLLAQIQFLNLKNS